MMIEIALDLVPVLRWRLSALLWAEKSSACATTFLRRAKKLRSIAQLALQLLYIASHHLTYRCFLLHHSFEVRGQPRWLRLRPPPGASRPSRLISFRHALSERAAPATYSTANDIALFTTAPKTKGAPSGIREGAQLIRHVQTHDPRRPEPGSKRPHRNESLSGLHGNLLGYLRTRATFGTVYHYFSNR